MGEGLQVLTAVGVHEKLAELASHAEMPWALIKDQVCAFADNLRGYGVYFVFSDDGVTVNKLHGALDASKDCYFSLPSGNVFVHPVGTAKQVIEGYGQAQLGVMWHLAKPHLLKFLDVLYTHNCFVARADAEGAKFLAEKTREKPVSIRMKG
jgi:hypothetical protein